MAAQDSGQLPWPGDQDRARRVVAETLVAGGMTVRAAPGHDNSSPPGMDVADPACDDLARVYVEESGYVEVQYWGGVDEDAGDEAYAGVARQVIRLLAGPGPLPPAQPGSGIIGPGLVPGA
jgi:hypothetical protein